MIKWPRAPLPGVSLWYDYHTVFRMCRPRGSVARLSDQTSTTQVRFESGSRRRTHLRPLDIICSRSRLWGTCERRSRNASWGRCTCGSFWRFLNVLRAGCAFYSIYGSAGRYSLVAGRQVDITCGIEATAAMARTTRLPLTGYGNSQRYTAAASTLNVGTFS